MVEMHSPEQLVECAYHEGGHAVAAVRLGFKVHGMSLIPEEEYGAVVIWDNPLETLNRAIVKSGVQRIDQAAS